MTATTSSEVVKRVITAYELRAKAITPSNSVDLTDHDGNPQSQHVYVGTGGTVRVLPAGNAEGQTVDYVIPSGGVIPVRVRRVLVTGTVTATNFVGSW